MAERHPREETLRRVHGTGALFSAAYGNVGSSIYYALGVTAAFALGLTPVAFVIAGIIFMFTAASYTEATVMYPEAGGSSSFARHADTAAEPTIHAKARTAIRPPWVYRSRIVL
jgi:APA family basic amino acid/polyamine antiporter